MELLITVIVPSPLPWPMGMGGLEIMQPGGGGGQGEGLGLKPSDFWAHHRQVGSAPGPGMLAETRGS